MPNMTIGWEATEGEIVRKLLLLVGLSMIGVLMFAPAASATCVAKSASASGSASASPCNDFFTTVLSGSPSASPNSTAAASPVPIPSSGGPAILLPTAALLLWSGILTYAILRRR